MPRGTGTNRFKPDGPFGPSVHVVIGGAGEVGRKIAEALRRDDHDVVVMDIDPEACDTVEQQVDCMVVEGHAASSEDLDRAGIDEAEIFYAVTSHDEVNLAAAAIAKSHGAGRVFARVNSSDLMDEAESRGFRAIGVDIAVSPDLAAATKLARLTGFPGILEIDAFDVGDLRVGEIRVESGSPAAGRHVKDLDLPRGVNMVALFRGAEVEIPTGSDVVHRGDHAVLVLSPEVSVEDVTRTFGGRASIHEDHGRPDRVVVAGASGVARRVARMLTREGLRVTMIAEAENRQKIERLAADMEGVLVLEGSSRDVRVFQEESLDEADVVIAASPREEYNLITALLARSLGVDRTMALVDQPELEDLAERIGVDAAVSPRLTAVSTLLKHASDLDPEELTLLHHGEAQVLVVDIDAGDPLAGLRLREAELPRGAIVAAIIREGATIVPRGDERIRPGDGVVLFATTAAVSKLSDLL